MKKNFKKNGCCYTIQLHTILYVLQVQLYEGHSSQTSSAKKEMSEDVVQDEEREQQQSWPLAPNRWSPEESALLDEMKSQLHDDLQAVPQFPEVIGDRRLIRFIRGHKHDLSRAIKKMRSMLKWRKDNDVDAVRLDIVRNKKFHPRCVFDWHLLTGVNA